MLTKQNSRFRSPDGFASNINIQISIEHFVIIKAISVFVFDTVRNKKGKYVTISK